MKTLVAILITILAFIIVGSVTLFIIGIVQNYPLEEDPSAPFHYLELSNPTTLTPTPNVGMGGVPAAAPATLKQSKGPDPYPPPATPNPYPPPPTSVPDVSKTPTMDWYSLCTMKDNIGQYDQFCCRELEFTCQYLPTLAPE